MRFKTLLFTLFTFLCATLMLAANPSDTLPYGTVLFKITHPHSTKTSYLFGTHHAFGKPFFDSLTSANNLLAASDVLILENVKMAGHTAEDIINKRETRTAWHKYLSKKDWHFVNDLFASSPTDYKKITPTEMFVFLNRYYNQHICLEKSSTDTLFSLDDYIGLIGQRKNLKIVGLETTEEQIDLINKDVEGMPRKVHKKRLANMIKKIASKDARNCEETSWYSNMKIDYQLSKQCGNTLMLTNRNNLWMETITVQLKKHNCFIAVGLSHLMYQCGLIAQLRALNFTVEPIPVID